MAVMNFIQVLAVAQAVLFFGTPVVGNRIPLKNRAIANTTSPAISPTITPSPSFKVSTGSFDLNACSAAKDDLEWHDCYRSGNPEAIGFQPSDNPYNTTQFPLNIVPANPSLANLCGSLWTSSASAFFATAVVTTQEINTSPTVYWTDFQESFSFTPTTPCCLNCTLLGGSVSVLMWPTPAPTPAVATLIDTGTNFTFVSPSVYVVFESIGATDMCGTVGTAILNKTLAFESTALSTQRNYYAASDASDLNVNYCTHATPNGPWETFDYVNAANGKCTEVTTSWWSHYASNDTTKYTAESDYASASDISCGFGCLGMPINEFTCVYNPCSPWVSVPTQVYNLEPKFSTCIDGIKAFFDPPSTLTRGTGLVAFTSIPASSSTATPAGTPAPVTVSATPTPSPVAPTPTPTSASKEPAPPSSTSVPADPDKTPSSSPGNSVGSASLPVSSNPPAGSAPESSTQTAVDPSTAVAVESTANTAQAVSSLNTSPLPIATFDSITISRDLSSNIIISSQTIAPGGPAVTIGSQIINLAPSASAIIVNGISTTVPIPTAAQSVATFAIGSQIATAGGAPITVSGTTYSLAPSASAIIINGVSTTVPIPTAAQSVATVAIGSQIATAGAGGAPVIVSGTTYSLASSGNAIQINNVPASFSPAPTPQLITTNSATLLQVGSQTLLPGSSSLVVSGTTYALAAGGSAVLVNGVASSLTPAPTGLHIVSSAGAPLLLVGSQTLLPGSTLVAAGKTYSLSPSGAAIVVDGTSQYLVASQTLVAGGAAVTVGGTVVSLATGGQSVVVGGSTEPVASFLGTATSDAIGSAIVTIGGLGGGAASSSAAGGYNQTYFTAGVGRKDARDVMGVGIVWIACLGAVWML